jgi:Zn-dependent protease with chaperone function
VTTQPVRRRQPLPEISSRAWEHPADRGALVALRKLRGFDTLIKKLSGLFNERAVRLQFLGSAIRVDERQFPALHALLVEAATGIDSPTVPELYVTSHPVPTAMTIGMDKAFVVVSSGLVDLLDEEELRFVLGHETGHVLSGHAVYQTLLLRLINLSGVLTTLPPFGLAVRAIIAALMEWSRKSELSADRAGLLATQDPAVAFRVHMKLASGGHLDQLDPTSFFAQGAEYEQTGDLRDSVLKMLLIERQTHPFAVVRAS